MEKINIYFCIHNNVSISITVYVIFRRNIVQIPTHERQYNAQLVGCGLSTGLLRKWSRPTHT
jgi:hypothetical protein